MATFIEQSLATKDPTSKVMWLSLDQGVARAAEVGVILAKHTLKMYGLRGDCFLYGAAANAPSRKFPIHKASFEQWLSGKRDPSLKKRRKNFEKTDHDKEVAAA